MTSSSKSIKVVDLASFFASDPVFAKRLDGLDRQPRDGFISSNELTVALMEHSKRPVVSSLFQHGISSKQIRPELMALFGNMNAAQQAELMFLLDGDKQAELLFSLHNKNATDPFYDMSHLLYQLARRESGLMTAAVFIELKEKKGAAFVEKLLEYAERNARNIYPAFKKFADTVRFYLRTHRSPTDAKRGSSEISYFTNMQTVARTAIKLKAELPDIFIRVQHPFYTQKKQHGVVILKTCLGESYLLTPETGFKPCFVAADVQNKTSYSDSDLIKMEKTRLDGLFYEFNGEYALAAREYEDALKLFPNHPPLYFYLALVLKKMGRIQESRNALKQSLMLWKDPKNLPSEWGDDLDQLHDKAVKMDDELIE